MARSVRVEFPGAFYHVMARGNPRERFSRERSVDEYCTSLLESSINSHSHCVRGPVW